MPARSTPDLLLPDSMAHSFFRPLLAALVLAAAPSHAATIVVDSGTDDGTGGCTLREAVESAVTGTAVGGCAAGGASGFDTIEVAVPTVTLASPLVLTTQISIVGTLGPPTMIARTGTGRTIEMAGATTTLELRNLRLSGGPVAPSGGVLVEGGATLSVESSGFENNTAEGFGGAIAAFGDSNVDVVMTTFLDNRALDAGTNQGGGAIYVEGSTLGIDESDFSGNRALADGARGGAVLARSGSTVVITSSDFVDNRTFRAGGGVRVEVSTATVSGSTFLDNRATVGSLARGGAFSAHASTVTLTDVTARDNAAAGGGGVAFTAGTATLTNPTLRSNRSVGPQTGDGGGALHVDQNADVTLLGGEISRNVSIASINGRGGGIYVGTGTLDATGTVVEANRARRNGGGLFTFFGTVTFTGASITGNRTTEAPTPSNRFSDGGGIWMSETSNVTLTETTVSGNLAKRAGGGLFVRGDASLTVSGGFITNNRALGRETGDGGGGAYLSGTGTILLVETRIEDNQARADRAVGGGVLVEGAEASFQRTTFVRNRGGKGGGGLAVRGGGSVVVEGTEPRVVLFEGNTTGRDTGDGGAIYLRDTSTANVILTRFELNDAWRYGGAVFAEPSSTLFLTRSTLRDNRARIDGGGVYQMTSLARNTLRVSQCAVFFNVAERGRGGGFFVGSGASGEIVNTTIHANTARFGGGLFSDDADLLIENVTATDNTALTSGGGFGNTDGNDRPVRLRNTIVADNLPGDLQGRYASDGHNLIASSPSAATFAAVPSDQLGTAPLLGPLADNGGPTFSRLPAAGSPAVDAGDTVEPRDQRGELRLSDDDVGAVERVGSDALVEAPDATALSRAAEAEPVVLSAAPNPVRDRATVRFSVADAQPVTVSLVDVTGRRVRTLFEGAPGPGEPVSVAVDAGTLAAGVYVVVLEGASVRAVRQLSVVR